MASKNVSQFSHLALNTTGSIPCALRGQAVLNTPYFNKGSAFPAHERRAFDLTGLLPQNVQTLEEQVRRAHDQYLSQANDLSRNTFLASLKEQNEVLYFKLLQDNLKAMFSVVYTPTEGDAIQNYSRLFRRPEGCFLNINDRERLSGDLAMWGEAEDIDYIVVTDGEEILGVGDQGVGGILISVAKLVLATLCAGVHPNRCLPVVLDCGTDNEDLLKDELYLGLREKRVRGKRYDEFVDSFVQAARDLYPLAYIHFEDFGLPNGWASPLSIPCYPSPCVSSYSAADIRRSQTDSRHISSRNGLFQRRRPRDGMRNPGCHHGWPARVRADTRRREDGRLRGGQRRSRNRRPGPRCHSRRGRHLARRGIQADMVWLIDRPGLLTSEVDVSDAQRPFAKDASDWARASGKTDLLSVVQAVHPNVLVGTSTVAGAFTREVVAEMARHTARPIILPLSNPTRLHEQTPEHLLQWTQGKALVATGSPFDPVKGPWGSSGQEVAIEVAECNNSVVFPGIALGCILSRSRLLTDKMLVAAVQAVAGMSPALRDPTAPLLPDVDDVAVRQVSLQVARGVIKAAVKEAVATEEGIPSDDERLEEWIRVQMWEPRYRDLQKVELEGAGRAARGELRKAGTVERRV